MAQSVHAEDLRDLYERTNVLIEGKLAFMSTTPAEIKILTTKFAGKGIRFVSSNLHSSCS